MKNLQLASVLHEIGDLLELLGENQFRVRAWRRAARGVELLADDIDSVAAEGRLQDIEGVGKGIAAGIEQWLTTGRIDDHEALKERVPPGLLELTRVPGVGPKSAQLLYDELGVSNLDALEAACKEQRVRTVKGLGPKSEANILAGIERLRRRRGRTPVGEAQPLAEAVLKQLRGLDVVERAEATGSLRRGRETVGDLDFVVSSAYPAAVAEAFAALPGVTEVLAKGEAKASVLFPGDLRADLLVVEDRSFAAALHHFTGSKEHNIALRERAHARGLKVSEYGILRVADGAEVPVATEADVFAAVELPYIPPELREDGSEIAAARAGELPELVTLQDIRGDLHMHSTWSDGRHSIEEMAEAARAIGYAYIAITDHSRSLRVANGLTPERLREQWAEIDRLNDRWDDFRILKGTEVDILPDGSLDFDDEVLAELDVVIASVHGAMQQDEETMTARICRAMANPFVHIVGHPTGRLLGRRDPYAVDVERLLQCAAETGTILEINAHPERLDLKDIHAKGAKNAGALVVVNTDAHSRETLHYMEYGITVARRGWLTAAHVVNTLSLAELTALLGRKRDR